MKWLATVALLGGAALLGACEGSTSRTVAALEARVAALEHRATPAATPAAGDDGDLEAKVERLDADLRNVDRRLAAVEADVASLHHADLAGGQSDAAAADARREQRSERRDRMRSLTATYRQKLADVRNQYRDDPGNPERQRALRDVVEWYRTERRALIRGQ
jgi:Skp family chaperone for outer membrane proteins